jgi:addiction module RelB/DinJ family antitoxin
VDVHISTKVPEKTKREVDKVLAKYGLDMSSAIRLFVTRISEIKDMPFIIEKSESEKGSDRKKHAVKTTKNTTQPDNINKESSDNECETVDDLYIKYPALRKTKIYKLEEDTDGTLRIPQDFPKKWADAWEM